MPRPLPPGSWPSNILRAADLAQHVVDAATQVLNTTADAPRIHFHLQKIVDDLVPVLLGLESTIKGDRVLKPLEDWLYSLAEDVSVLLAQLEAAEETARGGETSEIQFPEVVQVIHTGRRGRPRKEVAPEVLQEAMRPGRKIPITRLAQKLNIDRHTLAGNLQRQGINHAFTKISDAALDAKVKEFQDANPDSGYRYLLAFLHRHDIRVQRQRVVDSIHRVNPVGTILRQRTTVQRREYRVPRPNALWHGDGHHKLIRWGIVIHGFIDGYCRTMTGIRANTNNTASTVLSLFLEAVEKYGTPSRVRGDRGGENKEVAVYMIMRRGLNRGSYLWGSSTNNSRIERIWVEVGSQFARPWRAFFYRLERDHHLDVQNKEHLWLLHLLFLQDINDDCTEFQHQWNTHPISGAGHNQSPQDIRLLGQLEHGMYTESDDFDDIHPTILEQYYGVDHNSEVSSDSDTNGSADSEGGFGHDSDPSSDDWDHPLSSPVHDANSLAEQIEASITPNISHDPISVPKHASPFQTEEYATAFQAMVEFFIQGNGDTPEGYGVRSEEWGEDGYPTLETISSGRRGGKKLNISLPLNIWLPRAELWAKSLRALYIVSSEERNMK